ncbi:hypothetical protein OG943_36965 [Amycolatopsis sp. NBC_00345]|uniref:hypothetical protein n=1 Tax=Amycolatopsis sp. NBC_00345 TaxID=2975955 RepID=UPI002E2623AE
MGEGTHNQIERVEGGVVVQAGTVRDLYFNLPLPPPVVTPHELPPVVRQLVGRDPEIAWCVERRDAPVLLVTGLSGVGRRALVRHRAAELEVQHTGGALYLDYNSVRSGGEELVSSALRRLLRGLGVQDDVMPRDDELPAWYRSTTAGRPKLLVVIENAREAEQIVKALPAGRGSTVLVAGAVETLVDVTELGGEVIRLKPLDDDHAAELFRSRAGLDVAIDDESLREVLAHCGGLPLALKQAANLLAAGRVLTSAELVERLGQSRAELTRRDEGFAKGESVFETSYQELPEPGRRVYRLLGIYPLLDFDVRAVGLLAGLDQDGARRLLGDLVSAQVLDRDGERYRMHPLVHDHAEVCARQSGVEEETAALRRVILGLRDLAYHADVAVLGQNRLRFTTVPTTTGPFSDKGEALAWFETEQQTLRELQAKAVELGLLDAAWQIAEASTAYYFNRRRYLEWMEIGERGIAAARLTGHIEAEARLLSTGSRAQCDLGLLDAAREAVTRAAELADRSGHPVLRASVREFVGRFHDRAGEPVLAQEAYRRSIELNDQAVEPRGTALARMFLGLSLSGRNGLVELERAHRWFEENNDSRMAVRALAAIGLTRVRLGLPQGIDALSAAADAMAVAGYFSYEAEVREQLREFLAEADPERARRELGRAVELYRRLGSPKADALEAELD